MQWSNLLQLKTGISPGSFVTRQSKGKKSYSTADSHCSIKFPFATRLELLNCVLLYISSEYKNRNFLKSMDGKYQKIQISVIPYQKTNTEL